ncbi:MAG: secondary thiamine-phosphate synthase enzyme YjbQ [Clostridia bacterium]|jgi:secondary thiamine-phosphate synthase enzyme|nr:YjbQ family protein [Clostridiaceae bacterium]
MEFQIKTTKDQAFYDITSFVERAIDEKGVKEGFAVVFVPHTTAGITINEKADPDVVTDILSDLNRVFPFSRQHLHFEGNSHAHIKASLTGSSCTVIIENGRLKLGTWQCIYFCEFDGPRNRKFFVKVIPG